MKSNFSKLHHRTWETDSLVAGDDVMIDGVMMRVWLFPRDGEVKDHRVLENVTLCSAYS